MCDVMCSVPQVSISGPLPFNIYICDLFFKEIEIDFANYAYGTTPYVCDSKTEVVTEILDRNLSKIFQWSLDNFLKANLNKCHFLTNKSGEDSISVKSEKITNSPKQKLLGVQFWNNLC